MRFAFPVAICLTLSSHVLAGLDVTAYSGLRKVEHAKLNRDGLPVAKNQVKLSPIDFPERFANLQAGAVYQFDRQVDFEAGSYSGFNIWRNELAKLGGYRAIKAKTAENKTEIRYDAAAWQSKSGPFWELINFSDAEGVIGPVACKKLYADFVAFHSAAMADPMPGFKESYQDWENALKMASNNGALEFH
ncbi:MAG: hypothetical protein JO142_16135 [Burkholderiales bacterium]|nr:hypothetical protein [Burkholderiales bacterium]